jgi:hypothetical protein
LRDLLEDEGADVDAERMQPSDEVVDAYLDGHAEAAEVRAVRRAMQANAGFREEVLALAELRRDLAGDGLRRDMDVVRVPADLNVAALPVARRPSRLRRVFWHPAAGYTTAAAAAFLMVIWTTRADRTSVPAGELAPSRVVGELVVLRHHVLRGDDAPPVVVVPVAEDIDLIMAAGSGASLDEAYQATLRRLSDQHIEAYVALARRSPDGGRLILRVDRNLLIPGTSYAVVFSPLRRTDRSAEAGAALSRDIVGRFTVAGP